MATTPRRRTLHSIVTSHPRRRDIPRTRRVSRVAVARGVRRRHIGFTPNSIVNPTKPLVLQSKEKRNPFRFERKWRLSLIEAVEKPLLHWNVRRRGRRRHIGFALNLISTHNTQRSTHPITNRKFYNLPTLKPTYDIIRQLLAGVLCLCMKDAERCGGICFVLGELSSACPCWWLHSCVRRRGQIRMA